MTRRCGYLIVAASVAIAALPIFLSAQTRTNTNGAAAATPRTRDGRPDLSGMWGGGGGGRPVNEDDRGNITDIFPSRRCGPTQVKCGDYTNQSVDQEFTGRLDPSRPLYRPEHWDRVIDLDMNTNREDPIFQCQPQGITRQGPPAKIVQTATEIIFFYGGGEDYRIIPIDGRKHDPVRARDVTYFGHAVGHWDGDTLVIDSIGFNDLTWLARGGYFHSDKLRVIERLRREGNVLHYQATVEDPEVLLEPWTLAPRQLRLNTNPNAFIPEGEPCRDYDSQNMVTQIRH